MKTKERWSQHYQEFAIILNMIMDELYWISNSVNEGTLKCSAITSTAFATLESME